jgi:hypothetical protein
MNFKTTYLLFAVLLIVVSFFAIFQMWTSKAKPEGLVFPDLKELKEESKDGKDKVAPEKLITKVEIEKTGTPGEKLVFERASADQRWQMKKPVDTRTDSIMIDDLVQRIVNLRKEEVKGGLPKSLADNGLEPPKVIITLSKGDEKSWKLSLGNESPGTGRKKLVYAVASEKPNEPVAISHQDVDTVYKSVKEFRDKALALESTLNALGVTINDGKTEFSLVKVDEPGKQDVWRFSKPELGEADYHGEGTANIPAGELVARISSVRDLLVAIEQLRVGYNQETKLDDFVADNVSDAELAKYGLEKGKPATLRIEVDTRPSGLRTGDTLGGDKKQKPVKEVLLIGKAILSEPKEKLEVLPAPKEEKTEGKEEKGEPKDARAGKEKEKVEPKDKPDAKDQDNAKPKEKEKPAAKENDEPKIEKYYARMENENNVVRVPAKNVDSILKALGDLNAMRNKDIVAFDTSKVDAVDIKTAGGLVKLRKVGSAEKWQLVEDGKLREADQEAVKELLNKLTTKRQVKDFPTKTDVELGLDEKSNPIEVSIWEDAIKDRKNVTSDPKLEKEPVKLIFAAKADPEKKDIAYVKRLRGKESPINLAIPEGLLGKVSEGRLAFLDKTLPSFTQFDEVTKIVLIRPEDKIVLEFEKDPKDDKVGLWKIKEPADQAGRKADPFKVGMLIDMVRTLHTDRLISEKASDKDLDRYGLKPGDYQITLTLKKPENKTEEKVYLFGRQNEKKDGRYAKQGERDLVFLVRPEVTEPVESSKVNSFVDTQVFNFPSGKVKAIKLSGWREAEKRTVTLNAELKEPKPGEPKVWMLTEENQKSLPDFKLDDVKLKQFVNNLSRLTASRFLVFKKGPKPDYKLDDKTRDLQIEMTMEDDKKPVTLTIGALVTDGDLKGYAAQCSALPGDVFLLPEGQFDKLLKDGLKYFSK